MNVAKRCSTIRAWAFLAASEKRCSTRNNGLQNQSVIFVQDEEGGEERVFLDPNALSDDGTVTANLFGASPDGRYVVEVQRRRLGPARNACA